MSRAAAPNLSRRRKPGDEIRRRGWPGRRRALTITICSPWDQFSGLVSANSAAPQVTLYLCWFVLPVREQFVATMRSKHPGVRVTVKRMSTARIVVLSIAPGTGGIAASPGSGAAKQAETVAEARQARRARTGAARNSRQTGFRTERKRQRRAPAHRQTDDGTEVTERAPEMKCTDRQPAERTLLVRILSCSAAAALALNPALARVIAAEATATPVISGGSAKTRFLALGIGKSVVIDLQRDVKDVLVADPKIANAVIRSAQRAYIIGSAVGQTNVVFFDSDGQQVAAYDIAVTRDLNGVRAALRQTLPGIRIEGVGDGVILTGSVSSPIEAQQAGDLAARLVGGAEKVVNSIAVRGRDQVMLKVNVSEVRRDIVKQMGVDLSASMNYGTAIVNFNNNNPFTAFGRPLVADNGLTASSVLKGLPTVTATMRAMESAGVVKTLAEPNLTAISGESATFIAGGEFPVPAGYTCDPTTHVCTTSISYT